MDDNRKVKICMHRIKELSNRLGEIYTIKEIEDGKDGRKEKNINLAEEIDKLKFYEDIYSVIEKEGVNQGDTYEEYNKYLQYVRKNLERYKEIKDDIEQNNMEEIKNINLLLREFERNLELFNPEK